jgi:AcrR family transcriptional regulator
VSAPQSDARRTRADAQQNRAKIIAVAIEHFRAHGAGASLDAIAREAGVGAGTLYRHFPQRDDLVAAVLQTREVVLQQEIERIDAMADADDALQSWLSVLDEYLASFDGLADPLGRALMGADSALAISCDWLIRTTQRCLHAAQAAGQARSDLSARDLFLLALAASWVSRSAVADPGSLLAVRAVIRDGIRAVAMASGQAALAASGGTPAEGSN